MLLAVLTAFPQKTLLLEKVGANRKFYFHTGDKFKLRTVSPDTVLAGHLWDIRGSGITLQTYIPLDLKLDNIGFVYLKHRFAYKFGIYCCIFSGVTFGVITINHLINHEQVFTPDMAYLTLPFLTAGIVCISLSVERIKIGQRWKLKVLDINIKG